MISCFEELCGAHPGEADQAENYQATIHLRRSSRAEQDLGQILLCWNWITNTFSLLGIAALTSVGSFNESEEKKDI